MNIYQLNNKLRKILENYDMEPQEFKWANREAKTKIIGAPRGYSTNNNEFTFLDTFNEIDLEAAADDISGFGKDELDEIIQKGFIDNWYGNYYIKCFNRELVNKIVHRAIEIAKGKGYYN